MATAAINVRFQGQSRTFSNRGLEWRSVGCFEISRGFMASLVRVLELASVAPVLLVATALNCGPALADSGFSVLGAKPTSRFRARTSGFEPKQR